MINYFTVLGLLPSRVNAVEAGGSMTICTEQAYLSEKQACIIAEKMRGSMLADSVSVHRGRHLLMPFNETRDDLSAQ
jgi:hypothetical protein